MKPQVQGDGFPQPYGKYQLLARIGQGGMAEVFRARLPGVAGFEKIVVIKRLFPHLAREAGVVEMFVNEAKIAAGVHHRNVVEVYELGQAEDGEFYIAMEHVAGTDLRQILRGAALASMRIPPWFSVHVMIEVLEGLAYVHALCEANGKPRRIVHRDVTPANIFVSQLGDIKLGDFGVAKDESRSSKTKAGQLKGKIPYMSPEQLYSRDLDGRSDVFAAATVLWECLTQRRLFGGRPDIESMNLICSGERRPPSALMNDLPRELDEVVLRALHPDAAQRTRSAAEFQGQLIEVLRQMRPHVHQSEVRGVVEVLVGNQEPAPVVASTSDTGVKSFSEPTPPLEAGERPGTGSGVSSVHRPSAPPGGRLVPLASGGPVPSASQVGFQSLSSEGFRWNTGMMAAHPVPTTLPTLPNPLATSSPGVPASVLSSPAGLPPLATDDPFAFQTQERRVTDDYPRELLSPLYAPASLPVSTSSPYVDAPPVNPALAASPLPGRASSPGPISPAVPVAIQGVPNTPPSRFPPRRTTPVKSTYEGPDPLWVRTHQGQVLGPMAYMDALNLVFQEARNGFVDGTFVGTHPTRWMDANSFAILTGQEILLDPCVDKEKPMPNVRFAGTLGRTSAVALFARIAREKPTGRLIISAQVFGQNLRREIVLREGRPTFVYGNSIDVQLPQMLLEKRVVTRETLGGLLQRVIGEERPLDELVAQDTGVEVQRTFGSLMKERLVDMFRWSIGQYALDLDAPITHTAPFAHSILALAPELLVKTQTVVDLRELLEPYMHVELDRAPQFSRGLAELGLPEREAQAVWSFSQAPLATVIHPGDRDELLKLALAYTMIEAGHLVAPR